MEGGGTDTWVIVVAAFGGGLAGAVLQPIVGHVLELARSDVGHRKGTERRLRRMIMSQIVYGRRVLAKATVFALHERLGRPKDQTERLAELSALMPDDYLWEPTRIRDRRLLGAVEKYTKCGDELWGECGAANVDTARLIALSKELEQIQPEITSRMDELNWPEIEDLP